MEPMLATHSPTGRIPPGEQWVHEVKWDGIRLMADVRSGELRLTNRRGIDVTVAYPELGWAGGMPEDVLLDGEVVAVNPDGTSNLKAIAPRIHLRDPKRIAQIAATRPVQYMVFDVLRLESRDLTRLPLGERRELLEGVGLEANGSSWQVPPQYDDGELLSQVTLEAGLEGVISKRRDSPYLPGTRSTNWLKVPHRTEFVGVIGGWVPETENPKRLGALWIGHPHDEESFPTDGLLYPITRAGSGLSSAVRDELLGVLTSIEVDACPFVPRPTGPELKRAHWVEPILCIQVRFLGQPGSFSIDNAASAPEAGQLRQPVLRRLRPDVTPLEAPYVEVEEPV